MNLSIVESGIFCAYISCNSADVIGLTLLTTPMSNLHWDQVKGQILPLSALFSSD